MTEILEVLGRVEDGLARLRRQTVLRSLQDGLSADDVGALLGSVGLTSNPELDTLYGWHDGTSPGGVLGDIDVFPGFYLLSLEDAVVDYRACVPDDRWSPAWVPVFSDGGGDFYVVDLGADDRAPVRHFRNEEIEQPVEFSSLTAMLTTIAEAFERGVIFLDPNGYLEMDYAVFAALAAELNPDVEWWTELS